MLTLKTTIAYFFYLIVLLPVTLYAEQNCQTTTIPATTPTVRFIKNTDNTVTDIKTGLMWKRCLENDITNDCSNYSIYTWQSALQHVSNINHQEGFAGFYDWRLPNLKELRSIIERQCMFPAVNLSVFFNIHKTGFSSVWTSSNIPLKYTNSNIRVITFTDGQEATTRMDSTHAILLVRNTQ